MQPKNDITQRYKVTILPEKITIHYNEKMVGYATQQKAFLSLPGNLTGDIGTLGHVLYMWLDNKYHHLLPNRTVH
jgi:hypothetical protein